jgi:hypothetical protein
MGFGYPQNDHGSKRPFNKEIIFWLLVILTFTAVVYLPALENGFVSLDDKKYIVNNSLIHGFSLRNIRIIFTQSFDGNYHPLILLSLAANYFFSGLDPLPYHATNIAFHLINTSLVFLFLYLLTGSKKIAVVGGMLFGIHASHVESVAWISSRKNLIYAMFYLASLSAYVQYVRQGCKSFYIGSLFLFILALLSKGQAVTKAHEINSKETIDR